MLAISDWMICDWQKFIPHGLWGYDTDMRIVVGHCLEVLSLEPCTWPRTSFIVLLISLREPCPLASPPLKPHLNINISVIQSQYRDSEGHTLPDHSPGTPLKSLSELVLEYLSHNPVYESVFQPDRNVGSEKQVSDILKCHGHELQRQVCQQSTHTEGPEHEPQSPHDKLMLCHLLVISVLWTQRHEDV